jgi:hypothetical protein
VGEDRASILRAIDPSLGDLSPGRAEKEYLRLCADIMTGFQEEPRLPRLDREQRLIDVGLEQWDDRVLPWVLADGVVDLEGWTLMQLDARLRALGAVCGEHADRYAALDAFRSPLWDPSARVVEFRHWRRGRWNEVAQWLTDAIDRVVDFRQQRREALVARYVLLTRRADPTRFVSEFDREAWRSALTCWKVS